MSDTTEQVFKIKKWAEKTSIHYVTRPIGSRLSDELQAAGVEIGTVAPALISLLTTETNPYLLERLIWLAYTLKVESAIPPLLQLARTELQRQNTLSWWLVKALVALKTPEIVDFAISLLENEQAEVRYWGVRLLEELRATENIPALLKISESERNDKVRALTLDVLAQMDVKEVIPAFVAMLNGENEFSSQRALTVLSRLKAYEALPRIIEFIRDNDFKYGLAQALQALHTLGGRDRAAEFIGWLKVENSRLRERAVILLDYLDIKEAGLPILEVLNDSDPLVRYRAAQALGKWRVQAAIPQLITTLQDSEPEVREAAVVALSQLQAKEAVSALLKMLKSPGFGDIATPRFRQSLYQQVVLTLERLGEAEVQKMIEPELARVRTELEREREQQESRLRGDHF